MNTKINNTLFSFTTLRNPEKLEDEKKEQFFIYMPENTSPETSLLEAETIEDFDSKLNLFQPLTYSQLKNYNSNLYKWSFYLCHNRQTITPSRYIEKYNQYELSTVGIPILADRVVWWDNFIYQLDVQNRPYYNITFQKEEDPDAREALMILIYGYYLLEKFTVNTPTEESPFLTLTGNSTSTPVEEKNYKRILQARIVEPSFIKMLSAQ